MFIDNQWGRSNLCVIYAVTESVPIVHMSHFVCCLIHGVHIVFAAFKKLYTTWGTYSVFKSHLIHMLFNTWSTCNEYVTFGVLCSMSLTTCGTYSVYITFNMLFNTWKTYIVYIT